MQFKEGVKVEKSGNRETCEEAMAVVQGNKGDAWRWSEQIDLRLFKKQNQQDLVNDEGGRPGWSPLNS